MSVQIIPYQGNTPGIRISNLNKLLDLRRPVHSGACFTNLDKTFTGERFAKPENTADTVTLVFGIILFRFTRLRRYRCADFRY